MAWNPQLYLKNAAPRLRPALDILAQASLAASNRASLITSILDLGCGPGNITPFLHEVPLSYIYALSFYTEIGFS